MRGVFSSVFCDFGSEFTVTDDNGEEPVESFVANITKVTLMVNCCRWSTVYCDALPPTPNTQGNPGVVTCMENTKHNLESGDTVSFREVVGMTTINSTTHKIKGK